MELELQIRDTKNAKHPRRQPLMRPKLIMQASSESVALGNSKSQAAIQTTAADTVHHSLQGPDIRELKNGNQKASGTKSSRKIIKGFHTPAPPYTRTHPTRLFSGKMCEAREMPEFILARKGQFVRS